MMIELIGSIFGLVLFGALLTAGLGAIFDFIEEVVSAVRG